MWVALNYVFSPHWCQNIQYHSLLKCFWNPKAERHSIKILLWLFSELDFHCVASSSNFFSPVGNSFSTVREFWFSLSLSLLKEGKRWGEEEEKKKKNCHFWGVGQKYMIQHTWWGPLLTLAIHTVLPLGSIGYHLLACAGLDFLKGGCWDEDSSAKGLV